MTDIFLSYARQDRERVRAVSAALQAEGWDVWWDPSEPQPDSAESMGGKLGAAGAVLVVWSFNARYADHVRSEAATGLYRNRLVQVRIDGVSPPRPFDQVDVIDLGDWSGGREHANWQALTTALRQSAGAPGKTRAMIDRQAASKARPLYLEKRRPALAPLIALAGLAGLGAAAWYVDPFGWRGGEGMMGEGIFKPKAETRETRPAGTQAAQRTGAGPQQIAADAAAAEMASAQAWANVDRKDARQLSAFVAKWPETPDAETAISLLRVMDAQAWIDAVEADTDAAYETYLERFPETGGYRPEMETDAHERLAALGVERSLAVSQIQSGLSLLGRYSGEINGEPSDSARAAVTLIAIDRGWTAPDLRKAAPRDLRRFGDLVMGEAARLGRRPGPDYTAAAASAEAADLMRQQQARDGVRAAASSAEDLAALALRDGDGRAWRGAVDAGSAEAMQRYLRDYPAGAHADEARAALSRLAPAAPFGADALPPAVKVAVEAARTAQASAVSRAADARARASEALRVAESARGAAPGTGELTTPEGYRFAGQLADGKFTGLGERAPANGNAGDRYRGDLRDGRGEGVGVLEYAAGGAAARREGEFAADAATGFGVTHWNNGDRYAGDASRGVLTFSDGRRYEGEIRNGAPDGAGALWSREGALLTAGRWANGQPADTPRTQ